MPHPTEPPRGYANTYFVQDRFQQEELTRLQIQDQLLTASMGGVLPEQPDPTIFQRVLDVGCGTGGWLIEAAKTYPNMSMLVGVDIDRKKLDYAQAQAEAQQVSDRVQFRIMDALGTLNFPENYFDLVNHRLGQGYVRTWEWPRLLQEYQRVTRPGKVVRVTEANFMVGDSSPALSQLNQLFLQAFYQSGRYFTPEGDGLISQLANLLHQSGLQDVQTRSYTLHYHAGTPEGQSFYENKRLIYRTMLPLLRKWTRVPADYEEIYQQMLNEMQQPDFVGTWELLTAWGTKPGPQTQRDI